MNISKILEQLIIKQDLTAEIMQQVISACMQGKLSDIQLGSFLALMRAKGETIDEFTSAAKTMQSVAHFIHLGDDLIDIVGTGGDGKNTFNVSTISSFVAAACNVKVAKHGNHSVSSKSGSADLLIEAGFKLNLEDEELKQCVESCGIAFLFAPPLS